MLGREVERRYQAVGIGSDDRVGNARQRRTQMFAAALKLSLGPNDRASDRLAHHDRDY